MPVVTGPEPESQTLPDLEAIRVRHGLGLETAAAELRDLLSHVVSEVGGPVLATLSSGVDSNSVVACLARAGTPVTAVTMTTPLATADESKWARMTAAHLGVELVEIPISPDEMLPAEGIVTRRESPVFNMYKQGWLLMADEARRRDIDRIVTGFSGDLLFGGGVSPGADLLLRGKAVRAAVYAKQQRRHYPSFARSVRAEIIGPIARQMFPRWWSRRASPVAWLHPSRISVWRDLQKRSVGPGLVPGRATRLDRIVDGSMQQLAEEPTLTEIGISQIHPVLDARLIQFALSLPTWLLYEGELDKLVLREAMRGILPDEIVELEKIMPSDLAIAALRAREEPLMELTRSMEAARMDIVLEEPLQAEVESFMRGEHGNMSFWNALTLEDWLRRWW